jgi:hypothetical protein
MPIDRLGDRITDFNPTEGDLGIAPQPRYRRIL